MTSLVDAGFVPTTDFVVSATQVSAFELCPRKWAFRYIDGVESPPNKYAELGLDTHGHLENWLRQGIVPGPASDKSVQLAQALIPHLPVPQIVDPQNVELDQYYSLCGVTFNLKVDLFMPALTTQVWFCGLCHAPQFQTPSGIVCVNGHGGVQGYSAAVTRPRVIDHKTCGDFKWALTSETLPNDVQGSLYGGWALHKTLASEVDLQWNYVRTKGAIATHPVVATVTGRRIQERLGKSLESARKMRVIAESGVKAMQVDYDARGCSAFGGCPHQARCNLSPQQRMSSVIAQVTAAREKAGETTMGSTEDFLASLARPGPNGASAQPAQAPMQYPPQQQPMQLPQQGAQQPLQYPPAQGVNPPQPTQAQAPLDFGAQQPQQPQQPLQYPPQQPQAPLQYPPQQQAPMQYPPATQQPPMQYAPQAQAPAPTTVLAGVAAEKKPRAPKERSAGDDPWVHFAEVALAQLVAMRMPPDQAAIGAAQYADHMAAEYARRK